MKLDYALFSKISQARIKPCTEDSIKSCRREGYKINALIKRQTRSKDKHNFVDRSHDTFVANCK